MSRTPFPTDQGGVSTVLGAILMFALLIVTLLTIQVKFVPVWDQQREQDNALVTSGQLAAIVGDLNRLTGNVTTIPISDTLALTHPEGFSFFQGFSVPGTATFSPSAGGSGMTMSSTQLTIQQNGGTQLFGLNEDWTTVPLSSSIANIKDILHLRIRVQNPTAPNTGNLMVGFTDLNGNCAGMLVISVGQVSGSTQDVELQSYGPTSGACPTAGLPACPGYCPITTSDTEYKKATPPYSYLDAFDPTLQFQSVLAAAKYPLSLLMSVNGGMPGSAVSGTITYDQITGGGTVRVGGGGVVVPNYSTSIPVGVLKVVIPNQQLPQQTYSLEYGALFLDQPDGSAMVAPPSFLASTTNTQTSLSWSFPAITGGSSTVAGTRSAVLVSTPGTSRQFIQAIAPDVTFVITTAHPAQWQSFWNTQLQLAGLSSSNVTPPASCSVHSASPQYTISTTATTATLIVYGPCPSGDTSNDVSLTFQQAGITETLQASG